MKKEKAKTKNQKSLPKIEPLPGAICAQKVRCGKPNCRCATGELHSGYFYRFYYAGGKLRKQYIRKADVPLIQACVAAYRRQRETERQMMRQINQSAALLRRCYRQILKVRL